MRSRAARRAAVEIDGKFWLADCGLQRLVPALGILQSNCLRSAWSKPICFWFAFGFVVLSMKPWDAKIAIAQLRTPPTGPRTLSTSPQSDERREREKCADPCTLFFVSSALSSFLRTSEAYSRSRIRYYYMYAGDGVLNRSGAACICTFEKTQ